MRTSVARTSEAKEIHLMMPPICMLTVQAVRSFMRMTGPKGKYVVLPSLTWPPLKLFGPIVNLIPAVVAAHMWRANSPLS